MNIKIDYQKKTATITVQLNESLVPSSTGETESLVLIKNQPIGQNYADGRPIKMTLQLYVKPPKLAA